MHAKRPDDMTCPILSEKRGPAKAAAEEAPKGQKSLLRGLWAATAMPAEPLSWSEMDLIRARLHRLALPLGIAVCLTGVPTAGVLAQAQPVTAVPDEATVQSSRAYKIRQGDLLNVTVFGEPTLTPQGPVRVVQGGTVALPLVGDVVVGGLTTTQASQLVLGKLRKYVRDPRVTVAVFSVGPVEALVLGNVKVPGKYTLPPPARLTDVLAAAGGLGPTNGDLPDARIESPSGQTASVSLQKLLRGGDATLNAAVESGATVYIPSPTSFDVDVTGAVDKPGAVTLFEGDDVAMAVARAGASTNSNPDLNHVVVTRKSLDGTATTMSVNLYPILKNGDMSHDVKMQKGDIVFVPQAGKHASFLDLLFPLRALVP